MKLVFTTLSFLASQLNLFYLALSTFSRLPVPKQLDFSDLLLQKSLRYFSLVGCLLGFLLALAYYLLSFAFSPVISSLLVVTLSVLLTGAFHEDGLADMADGMAGGYTQQRRLSIMKDSQIGSYGAISLVLALMLKIALLIELAQVGREQVMFALLLSASLSRGLAISLLVDMTYVSDNKTSKHNALAQFSSKKDLVLVLLIACLPLVLYPAIVSLSCLLVLLFFRYLYKSWLLAKIKGFTGDCLGGAQQLSELFIYLVLVFYLK